ncbi:MAG: 6-phosphogluconolactonase [Bacteroidota bacterium]|nr:6-phosphogluconolactonase [Bacteroidota bacterium]MDP4233477.1 6-phosphogluconolactonase [Bacteroidota bacterium]MDP4243355.1 6-phosphogluconolactonase [Bacteroidota bacterium]MDP4287959.1 6-phosphogluconolactonase [Bacteroidota bacterium]
MTPDPAKIPVTIHTDHTALARAVAERIAAIVRAKPDAVLGLPTGSTPKGIYRELIALHNAGLDLSRVRTFNLDEYFPIAPDALQSYHRFMQQNFFRHVNIAPENIHIPRGDLAREDVAGYCAEYDRTIAEYGGLDFVLLGIGRSGHIGFNEPGTPETSRTRLILIHPFTRRDAAADFFGENNVPREAITMGIATILSSREIILAALGENKSGIVCRAVEGPRTTELPASLLQSHPHAAFHLDRDAAADLTRVKTPWLVQQYFEFTQQSEVLRAIIWLAEKLDKPIVELSSDDYIGHGLASLVMEETADALNRKSANTLAKKVHDRDHLPKGERIIVFSPHPDDDVISAGGMFRKLVENGNDVFVAYQTSGNIAVFDHDVLRYLDFIGKYLDAMQIDSAAHEATRQKIEHFLETKAPGEVDLPEVAYVKQFIREAEAVSAAMHVGLEREHCIFMNLPFYQTGAIEKAPPGEADVEQTVKLLMTMKPTRILAAGDLSDPHGTHRVCLWIIQEALKRIPNKPIVWLYRGAWQEWPLDEADVLVPMSENELALKLEAIFKHQSQKDRAMFPGPDEREFWQRVHDRNTATARRFYRLGLPYYHAMEAYVESNR